MDYCKAYYQENKEHINKMNSDNHKRNPIRNREITNKSANKICICNVCEREMKMGWFYNHKKFEPHKSKVIDFPSDKPIFTRIPSV